MPGWVVLSVSTAYVVILFLIAWWTDRRGAGRRLAVPTEWMAALGYALTLAIYNTSWSFYGSVGRALSGFDFLSIYVGPTLVLIFGQRLIARIVTVAKSQNITSIADFIAARYGKSQALAALVTMAALLAVLPYIALQLKAVGTSFDILTAPAVAPEGVRPIRGDSTFAVAASMALFAIMFGVRHIHASEHHRGLMAAIAFESLVKLSAFVIVALFIVFRMFDGLGDLVARAEADPRMGSLLAPDFFDPTWISNTIIAAISFLCLPHMFHVAVVENKSLSQVRAAAWLYPAYLIVFSVLMVPIAIAGIARFADTVNPDTFVISLPLAADAPLMALIAFLGGFSAATGMVIVASVALSTMLCNDVIVPLLLRSRLVGRGGAIWPSPSALLLVRRISVAAILLLAYMMNRLVDQAYPLTVIGLLSFVAIAQFGPAFLGGLLWRRAKSAGAGAGIVVGFAFWIYTLLLPSIAPLVPAVDAVVANGPLGLAWLRPQSLFGIVGLDPISHATLWSLGANLAVFAAVSLLADRSPLERLQAEAFAEGVPAPPPLASLPLVTRLDDLKTLAARFVGAERSVSAFDDFVEQRRARQDGLADVDAMRFTENLIAGALGAASARVVMAAALESRSLSRKAAVGMLDEASQALHFNRKLLQGALESVPQGICVFDADLAIEAWNARFLTLLDLPKDLIRVGLPLADLVDFNRERGEYDGEDLKALLVNRDLARQSWPYVYERKRPDGMVLEIAYDRMAESGYISTYTDVTERHRAAAGLRRANEELERRVQERTQALEQAKAEAERANIGKTRFLAAASHDLLQPLNAARLYLAALDESLRLKPDEAEKDLRTEERALAKNAAAALSSTERLLDELLDISSYDSGAVRAQPVDFSVGSLLAQLELEFSALARQRGLTLKVVASTRFVRTDPQLLRRVLQNLLSNAIRYTPRGRVLLGCRRRKDGLRIEVRDTGIGIAPERQKEIFEEFRRLDTGEEREKGSGLGLAIVERICRLLDLPLKVRSRPGQGTCFIVTVPLAAQGAAVAVSEKTATPSIANHAALTVLCVDNDAAIREGLSALLSRWGHRPIVASDERTALANCNGLVPDLALVDYHLDGTTGVEVLDGLRKHWGREVRGLVITADRSEEVSAKAKALGCEVMAKPVKPAALRRYLDAVALLKGAGLQGEEEHEHAHRHRG
ncbi:Na+/proline symporter/signal transduction histidine kinase/ActR/RegA family two-component response regulator [Sinorhizobium fredii]|uniref:histidine kinase n=1 Tax=Sinorhizobium fredii (strain USDA 257) TaxID=1185652 RepID=I3X4B8_SINF2|nr:PAS domain-containing hybrid sensor histidine kinase/response regulator [Sinorhizobium fredii]AFL50724.1 autoinducer 2 sensor kinase/phosphatase LuxQ [Sinorhizobium fredii USDA 257]